MSGPRAYVLAIDLGTGGPKVGLVDDTGRVVASGFERNAITFLPSGGAEQDPNEWWQSTLRTAKWVLRQAAVPPDSVVAIGCTSQWSVTVAVDEHGDPLMNAISWMDTRGARYNKEITHGFPSVQGYGVAKMIQWIRLAGLPPTHSGVDALGHMLFIQHERPEVFRKTYKFLEPMDFINFRLTGRCAASQSTVLPMIVTDNRSTECLRYDPWLLRAAGIDPAKLPDLLPNDGIVGPLSPAMAAELGLSPRTQVIVGAGDNHTSAIGSGAVHDYEAVAVLGTSGMLCCHVPFKKTDLSSFIATMPSPLPGRRLIFGDLGNNGKVLDSYLSNQIFCKDPYGGLEHTPDVYDRMNQAAEQAPPGSGGLLFLPWFNGTLCPQEDAAMRGGFLNLSHITRRTHMTRAVLEGIAYNWRWLLGPAQKFVGRRFPYLRLAGGGAQSDTWAQIMADVLNLPIHQQADPRNGNVLGIAFLAFLRLGRLTLEDIPGMVRIARVFEPRPENRETYDRLFAQFMVCQKALKPVFHALNRAG
jgi:xylulokinase